MDITAAIIDSRGGTFTMEAVKLDEPKDNEVLVEVIASGMCHTDLAVRNQLIPLPLPIVLGHEGAGIVRSVGSNVKKVVPGDHVVLSFSSCGQCGQCQNGLPSYCNHALALNFGGARADGSYTHHSDSRAEVHGNFFGQSSFATYALATERNIVKVDKEVPLEILGPLGCGIQTGAGAVINTLRPKAGASLVVFGSGAVGLSAIMAAKAVGCLDIIAVDVIDARLEFSKELGATMTVNSRDNAAVDVLRKHFPQGIDFAFDTTGRPEVIRNAVSVLKSNGICGIVGASGEPLTLDANYLVAHGIAVKGIAEGDSIPDLFIPQLIALYKSGNFPFDKLITFYDFENINEAAADIERGTAIKPVLKIR